MTDKQLKILSFVTSFSVMALILFLVVSFFEYAILIAAGAVVLFYAFVFGRLLYEVLYAEIKYWIERRRLNKKC